MGRRFTLSFHRTAAALVLTAVAVAVPSAAWYLAASRKIDREVDLQEKGLYGKAQAKAEALAGGLARRLELLREAESQRAFYHYRNLYHDPRAAAEGASVSISPLAEGAADPLIEAHFQIDENGRLTLPTLNDEFPELSLTTDEAQCSLVNQLEEIAFLALDPQAFGGARFGAAAGVTDDAIGGVQVETLTLRAWRQHLRANALYADLKYGRSSSRRHATDLDGGPDAGERIEIAVSALAWHTLPVGDRSSLVALRSVDTPAGVWTQGFVVSHHTVEQYLESSIYPASFVPLDPSREIGGGEVLVAIGGTPWGVALDLGDDLRQAAGKAAAERDRFLRFFVLGILAAGVAGLVVVTLVFQSERLAQQRSQFAAAAAHELRTPLAGLRLYGEMLAEGLGNPGRARDYARRLAGEAERLGRVVTNVLSFTHLERGSLSVDPQPGDLGAAVGEACQRQRPALEESGAVLDVELQDDLPVVAFDRDAVAHILQNLLDNAEKYTRGVEGRRIRVALSRNGKGVDLSVTDNGHGIAPDLRRRLFRPFTRGGNRDSPEGLGLGLALVKVLAEAQGGAIAYRDAPAGGAMFTVSFALADAA
ncbi:MAG: HAMP domain-containing sensor histidine kinase [Thermoanaerobaculia bacterium]